MQASTYKARETVSRLPADAPNIVILMIDDAGPALPDTFGGPIRTPTMSEIANSGITYNRFHNAAMCSPTRAALLTGRNQHRVGFGQIAEFANAWDGYTGLWPATTASVAKVLGYYGYTTSAFGKWHNTPATDISRMGPFDRWPTGRLVGFDYFYGFLGGESSQWETAVIENTVRLPPQHHDGDYHFTEDMTDRAIAWLRNRRAVSPDKPFFMYWSPGAVHGPHHIFKEWADKYEGRFDEGWDVLREEIFAKQKALGWVPEGTQLTERAETMPAWEDIPESERAFQVRLMEVFAGFLEHTDRQAGRILDELERQQILDNTLVFYVWSDNGSSAEGQNGTISELMAQNGIPSRIEDHIEALEDIGGLDALGGPKTDNMYHAGWAWAGSTPFKHTKLIASHFGGTRTPLAVSWPERIAPDSEVRSQFYHVNDIVPTIYDVLGIEPPDIVDGVSQAPMDGVSMVSTFDDPDAPENKGPQYFEVMGSRAIYKDGWMASVFGPRIPWRPGVDPAIKSWNPEDDEWELYNLEADFSQAEDLAEAEPAQLKKMKKAFDREARENSVYPVGGGLWSMVLHPEDGPANPATEFHYTRDVIGLPEGAAARLGTVANRVVLDISVDAASEGVLYAMGAYSGGLSLWIDDGRLVYEYNTFQIARTRITADEALPPGDLKIEVETLRDPGVAQPAEINIVVNGEPYASGVVPMTASAGFTVNDTFDVGMDQYSPVSEAYYDRAPFAFTGKIRKMFVEYL